MEKINKIYGPPGTGKTFRLIKRVKAYQRKGVPLHKIGYFAFTRKAAEEARKRINVSEKEVPYFQTIHAFCYHLLGVNLFPSHDRGVSHDQGWETGKRIY